MSKEARLPQRARQEAFCDPLLHVCDDTVSSVTFVDTSLGVIVSVDPMESPPADPLLNDAVCDVLLASSTERQRQSASDFRGHFHNINFKHLKTNFCGKYLTPEETGRGTQHVTSNFVIYEACQCSQMKVTIKRTPGFGS